MALKLLRHACDARQPGTSAQGQQHSLDLIIRMLTQQHLAQPDALRSGRQRLVARSARSFLGAFAWRVSGLHFNNVQGNLPQSAHGLAMLGKIIGGGLKAMVHMQGNNGHCRLALLPTPKQSRGVCPPAKSHTHRWLGRPTRKGTRCGVVSGCQPWCRCSGHSSAAGHSVYPTVP